MSARSVSVEARFWTKVDKGDGCWLWTAAKHPEGYGRIKVDGLSVPAHRLAYELEVGPIPAGMVIDHLCRNTSCVRPSHLEVVTRWENTRRGVGWMAQQARKTHCLNGHAFDEDNTYSYRSGRGCRKCAALASARYRARRSAN